MSGALSGTPTSSGWVRAMPWVFVLIWSSGFVVARFGMPHAPPMKFLALRFALSLLFFVLWVRWARVAWPRDRAQWGHLAVTGALMHAGYLGGVWVAVKAGMGAGLSALLVGLQPILTALWLSGTGGRVGQRQWWGLGLGFAGLVLVLSGKLSAGVEATPFTLSMAVLALLAITAGTLYQKRWVTPCDVRSANAVQLLAALAVALPLALLETEAMRWQLSTGEPNTELIAAMAFSVLVLTVGGSSLLYLLLQRGAATGVASLMYLVPPCSAAMAWVLFGETITWATVIGTAITAAGVSLVLRPVQPAVLKS